MVPRTIYQIPSTMYPQAFTKMKPIVVDASAIINSFNLLNFGQKFITTPAVLDEVRGKKRNEKIRLALDLDSVEQRLAKNEFIEKVRLAAKQTNDMLSKQDEELIALALEHNAEIATDDYGIQNVAAKIGLVIIAVGEKGIKEILEWQHYCPACWKNYPTSVVCGVCGTPLKRKVRQTSGLLPSSFHS